MSKRDFVAELDEKINHFKNLFDKMNETMVRNIALAMGNGFKLAADYKHKVQVCSAEKAAQHLLDKKNVLLLTGAGISAASGIPTFRGEDGTCFWQTRKRYADESDPT